MIKKIKIIALVLIFWQCAMVGIAAGALPTPQEVANTVHNKWINREFPQLETYITNLYATHPDYIPAVLAASFYDYIYLGNLAEAVNKLDDVQQKAVDVAPDSFTLEFKGFLEQLRIDIQCEINLHERMGTSPEELQANASPETVRSVWGDTLLPSIDILFHAPAMNILKYELNMTEMPWYENIAPYYSTGAATCQMILRYIRDGARGEDPSIPVLTQDETYKYARDPEPYDGTDLNPDEIDKALGHFDPYDTLVSNPYDIYDSRLDGNPVQGYNYTVDTHPPLNMNEYMRDICHWMAYLVTQEEWWKGGALVARPNTPAAIPIFGDTEGYNHWVAVKGCAVSENPCPDPSNPWNTPDFTVYGFWMKDPQLPGIGQDVYVTAAEGESTYFKPLVTGDSYNGLLLQVAEPPAEKSYAQVEIPEPTLDLANLEFIGLDVGTIKSLSIAAMSYGMKESPLKKKSWRDLVDRYLLTDSEAVAAFEEAEMSEYILVKRIDQEDSDYYLVPFGQNDRGRLLASGVIILDAQEGYFKEASWTAHPEELIKVSGREAIRLVRRHIIREFFQELRSLSKRPWREYIQQRRRIFYKYLRLLRSLRYAQTQLVWEPANYSPSPYQPGWQVTINGASWYVTQKEEVIQQGSNHPPVLDPIGDKTVKVGQLLQFTIRATDPDGDPLTYSADSLPEGAVLDSSTGQFSWKPEYAQIGSHQVTFTVSDGELSDSETINIEVTADPPSISYIQPGSGSPGRYLRIRGRNFGPRLASSRVQFFGQGENKDAHILYWRDYHRRSYIICRVPELKKGTYEVRVINLAGESNPKSFQVLSKKAPRIYWLWPYRARVGEEVRIYGRNLAQQDAESKVLISGYGEDKYASIVSGSDRRIAFQVPKLKRKGWYRVRVSTKDGQSNHRYFYYY